MFNPGSVEVFRITSCCFDEETGTAVFGYAFDDETYFSETYVFPTPDSPLDDEIRSALDRTLMLLSITAGVSYYKACAAPTVSVEVGGLTDYERAYFEALYSVGLGEFYYRNELEPTGPQWRTTNAIGITADSLQLQDRALVAVGGGKDSCVSIEMLRGREILLASLNTAKPIQDVIDASGCDSATVARSISKTLIDLNDDGALNGHVPVTAIVSFALIALALITDCNAVVMSNERSASVGSVNWRGTEINHQWAKSLRCEQLIADVVHRSIANDLDYFSLLRPYSELDIARAFATNTLYDSSFTSCNKAFVQDLKKRENRWCNSCDKCRFVFLALAPNISPQRLISIFGVDLLADESQIPGFEALCGWHANKPFECVGEVEESITAFNQLSQKKEWSDHPVVSHMRNVVFPQLETSRVTAGLSNSPHSDAALDPYTPSSEHNIASRYLDLANTVALVAPVAPNPSDASAITFPESEPNSDDSSSPTDRNLTSL